MVRSKILIVEDESIVALNIKNRLEGLGYAVVATISCGESAIEAAAKNRPDLVLMDIKLKGKIDGIEAAGQIRSRFQIPVVYLTAYTDDETLNRAKLTEPYGYILKPFESRDLCTTIEIALYKHQMEQQLWEKKQWLATTLKSIGDAVITTDSQGLVTFMNPVAEALTCWKQEEVLGNDLTQVFYTINETTRQLVDNPVELALRDGVTVGLDNDTLLITKHGSEIPIDDSASPIKNDVGQVLGAVLVFHDVTRQQQVKAFLERANEELELRVAESTAQLRKTNEQLRKEIARRKRLERELLLALGKERELNELKSRILATISHEYRTPLTTILSSTELLEHYGSRLTEENKQKHFQRIQAAVKYLTELVNDVLFVNQTEVSSLEFSPVPLDIEEISREVVAGFQENATEEQGEETETGRIRKLTLSTTEKISSTAIIFRCEGACNQAFLDKKLLQSMLRNLLSNAIKYSPIEGEVQFNLILQDNEAIFQISDRGIGIPPQDLERLFNPFFRGSNVGVTPGVGLGLTIAKECVDLHGGEIFVNSEVGVGTTFTVILPLSQRIASD
ncbi:MAG: ATP-binding protein [Potamolinea sp.]